MTCRLFGVLPLYEQMLDPYQLNYKELISMKFYLKFFFFSFCEINLKMSSAKWWQFCLGLNMLTRFNVFPDNKVHGANMEPTWVLSAPDLPHVGPMNLAIRVDTHMRQWSGPLFHIHNSLLHICRTAISVQIHFPFKLNWKKISQIHISPSAWNHSVMKQSPTLIYL